MLVKDKSARAGELVTEVRKRAFKTNPSKAIVTDDELKENSSYKWGVVEKYQITDPATKIQ